MLRTEHTLASEQRALQVDERLRDFAASRTRLSQLLERDHDGHVMRREHFLANPQRMAVQALRRASSPSPRFATASPASAVATSG